ncbi:MAG: fumarylacetoacetate hydrolase family protein [Chitinophagales bacterium]|nr:fumarylacetoacetate hydrolase family protein [Chitinophagales bacterium]MCZ2393293.1 fumarylacetoacetate hydrolase family protein [Chitinophagales bacterium]
MKIFCVGRNYVEHARELQNEIPSEPVIFMKAPTALLKSEEALFYPDFTKDLHYEGELVVKISKNGKKIQEKFAHKYYSEISLGFDFTARDLQSQLKSKGLPWELAKSFDGAASVGTFLSKEDLMDKEGHYNFTIFKNNLVVQEGNTAMMLFSIDKIISFISQFFTLQQGDLIFTGTPSGVGALKIGDELKGQIKEQIVVKTVIK